MTIFEKTGFYTKQGVINHLRKKYNNFQIAYNDIFDIKELPVCKFCKKPAEFNSIFLGYRDYCTDKICVDKKRIETKLKNKQNVLNLQKNICKCCKNEYAHTVKTRKKLYCSDECAKSTQRVNRLEKNKIDWYINDFKLNCENYSYLNKLCFNLMCNYRNASIVKDILNQNFFIIYKQYKRSYLTKKHSILFNYMFDDNFNKTEFLKTPDDKFYLHKNLVSKQNFFNTFYSVDEYNKLIENYFPECFNFCKICGNKYKIKDPFFPTKFKSLSTCSIECHRKNYKQFMTIDRIQKQSSTIKNSILVGSFTPNVFNSFSHKKLIVTDITNNLELKFRSSWEVIFFIMHNNFINYESIRIKYKFKNKQRIYITDFEDPFNKIVFEIKPSTLINDEVNKLKLDALKKWCKNNNYTYKIITENELFKNINFKMFLDKLKEKQFIINDIKLLNKIENLLK